MDEVAEDFLDNIYCAFMSLGVEETYTEQEIRKAVISSMDASYVEDCESQLKMSMTQLMATSDKFQQCGGKLWKAVHWDIMNDVASSIGATKSAEKKARGRGRGRGMARGGRGHGAAVRGAGNTGGGLRGGLRGRGTPTGTCGAVLRGSNQPKQAPPPRANFPSQGSDPRPCPESRGNSDLNWNDQNISQSTTENFAGARGFGRQQNGYPSRAPSPQRRSPPCANNRSGFTSQDARNRGHGTNSKKRSKRLNLGECKSNVRDPQKGPSQDRWDYGLQRNGNRENQRPNYNLRASSPQNRPSTSSQDRWDIGLQSHGKTENRRPNYNLRPTSPKMSCLSTSSTSYKDPLHHKIIVSNDAPKPSTSGKNAPSSTFEHPKIVVKMRGVVEERQKEKKLKIATKKMNTLVTIVL